VLAALAIALGVGLTIGCYKWVAALGRSRVLAAGIGLLGAFLSGLLPLLGLHGAVAAGLGFGLFIGTAIFGAADDL
jgi:hypothetical protein